MRQGHSAVSKDVGSSLSCKAQMAFNETDGSVAMFVVEGLADINAHDFHRGGSN